jgi:hypothetical protein
LRAADHFVVGKKRQRRARGSRETEGALGDELQNLIVTDLADLQANCFQL